MFCSATCTTICRNWPGTPRDAGPGQIARHCRNDQEKDEISRKPSHIVAHLHGLLHLRAPGSRDESRTLINSRKDLTSGNPREHPVWRSHGRSASPALLSARFASFDALRVTSEELNSKKHVSPTFSRRASQDVSCWPVPREPLRGLRARHYQRAAVSAAWHEIRCRPRAVAPLTSAASEKEPRLCAPDATIVMGRGRIPE